MEYERLSLKVTRVAYDMLSEIKTMLEKKSEEPKSFSAAIEWLYEHQQKGGQ